MASLKTLISRERWVPVAIVVVAAALRLVLLEMKPAHFDEGVNGWFVDSMTTTGYYHYDPTNYHGPMHFYVLFLFQTLFGRHVWALRLPLALVSAASVYLVTRFDRFLDRRVCWFAALAMAVSPAAVFYGRYAIHESWLVFFLLLFVWGVAGLWKFGTKQYLWAAGLAIAGMILTKETYVIHLTCFVLAAACMMVMEVFSPSEGPAIARQVWTFADLAAVAVVAWGAILFFYSGGFFDVSALNGLWQTYAAWFEKGRAGEGHEKAWYYWLWLVAHYEWPVLVALPISVRWLFPHSHRLVRFFAIFGCAVLAADSIIPYKTPWCIIALLWPFYFLFGAILTDFPEFKLVPVYATAASLLAAASLVITVRLNFYHYADEDEPYVYVQTFPDIYKLTKPLLTLARRDPTNYQLTGNIISSSHHPLPWLLADFPNVSFYDEDSTVEEPDADFLLVDETALDKIEPGLKGTYFTEHITIRGGMGPSKLYLGYDKFKEFFPKTRRPEFPPATEESSPTLANP
jgi:uncharacterized protein (TIGR03663 family)